MAATKLIYFVRNALRRKYFASRRGLAVSDGVTNRRFSESAVKYEFADNEESQKLLNKILYSEYLNSVKYSIKRDVKILKDSSRANISHSRPISLQYLIDDGKPVKFEDKVKRFESYVAFPYEVTKNYIKEVSGKDDASETVPDQVANLTPSENVKIEAPNHWNTNSPKQYLLNDNIPDVIRFGTANPKMPISDVPCGGCGALLHCCSEGMPGYLPQEVFCNTRRRHLKSELCQRCYFLLEYNIALGVNVSPDEYPKLLEQIKNKTALIILIVDLLDFPCCIWAGFNEVIGLNDVIVAANKVDLFMSENDKYKRIKSTLTQSLADRGINVQKVMDIVLISAKTGYGIENLVNAINIKWGLKGDVYLVGSTNAGKSSLFNILIKSDLCRVEADSLLKRATVSNWPGTTLNLLKFPMKKFYGGFLYLRNKRLMEHNRMMKLATVKAESVTNTILDDVVTRTLRRNSLRGSYVDEFQSYGGVAEAPGIDRKDRRFRHCRWCYDTPGVIQYDQITNLLTTSELLRLQPQETIKPRTYKLKKGVTMFLAGVARVDFVEGSSVVWLTVYSSLSLPVTIVKTEDAEEVYEKFLGSTLFQVPSGGSERLSKWPKLAFKEVSIAGRYNDEATSDIVLSSAGWVSVLLLPAHYADLRVWTPEARGIHVRNTPVIAFGHKVKGEKLGGKVVRFRSKSRNFS